MNSHLCCSKCCVSLMCSICTCVKETEMTNQLRSEHPHADILRAIAEGKELEWSNVPNPTKYEIVSGDSAIFVLGNYSKYPHFSMRIKQEVKTGWIALMNVDPDDIDLKKVANSVAVYPTREEAIAMAKSFSRIKTVACIKVSYIPGEGLN